MFTFNNWYLSARWRCDLFLMHMFGRRILNILGVCPCCGSVFCKRRRTNTAYADDASNFIVACDMPVQRHN